MDEAIRQLAVYRDKYLAGNKRIESIEKHLADSLEELTAVRSVLRDLRRENDKLANQLRIAQLKSSWYRSKMKKFATSKWIDEEMKKDGIK